MKKQIFNQISQLKRSVPIIEHRVAPVISMVNLKLLNKIGARRTKKPSKSLDTNLDEYENILLDTILGTSFNWKK